MISTEAFQYGGDESALSFIHDSTSRNPDVKSVPHTQVKFHSISERVAPKSGSIKPIRGKSPAKQNKKGSQPDIPVDVDPCLPSDLPDPTPTEELCESTECPVYEVVEVAGTCGFELRKYTR